MIGIVYANTIQANVTAVTVQGKSGVYSFAVTLKSAETGCAQYADWWEVLSEEGTLLYRRILVHSHPNTQPFTRSGGSVKITKKSTVYVRAHMNKEGYVGSVMKGTVSKGFKVVTDLPTFSENIETQSPLPQGCLF
jgi:hypothetical protein